MLREAVNPFHPRCVRASGGASVRVTAASGDRPSASCALQGTEGLRVVALDRAGEPIAVSAFRRLCPVAGVEVPGLPDALGRARIHPHGRRR